MSKKGIAVEVARTWAWREKMFPGMNCRDVPAPSEPTLPELMDNSLAYARATQERLAKELGLPREPTPRGGLEKSLA